MRGLELEFNDSRHNCDPCEYNIVEQSGLQVDAKIGNCPRTIVERSIPLRDQILIEPSSPAINKRAFNYILYNGEILIIFYVNVPVNIAVPSKLH